MLSKVDLHIVLIEDLFGLEGIKLDDGIVFCQVDLLENKFIVVITIFKLILKKEHELAMIEYAGRHLGFSCLSLVSFL